MKIFLIGLMVLTATTSIFSQTDKRNFFAIYLLPKTFPFQNLSKTDLKKLRPHGEPLIHQNDIYRYNRDTHEFLLYLQTAEKLEKLEPKFRHRVFAVFVGNEAIYTGAFWSSISSQSFDGLTINLIPLKKKPATFSIDLGYPTEKFFTGEDLRADSRILQAFQQVNKLYENLEVVVKCKEIRWTGKHIPSYFVTFEILKVTKGTFEDKELKFELDFYFDKDQNEKLLDAIIKDGLPNTYQNQFKFDPEQQIILKVAKQISGEYPGNILVDWEIIKK